MLPPPTVLISSEYEVKRVSIITVSTGNGCIKYWLWLISNIFPFRVNTNLNNIICLIYSVLLAVCAILYLPYMLWICLGNILHILYIAIDFSNWLCCHFRYDWDITRNRSVIARRAQTKPNTPTTNYENMQTHFTIRNDEDALTVAHPHTARLNPTRAAMKETRLKLLLVSCIHISMHAGTAGVVAAVANSLSGITTNISTQMPLGAKIWIFPELVEKKKIV